MAELQESERYLRRAQHSARLVHTADLIIRALTVVTLVAVLLLVLSVDEKVNQSGITTDDTLDLFLCTQRVLLTPAEVRPETFSDPVLFAELCQVPVEYAEFVMARRDDHG